MVVHATQRERLGEYAQGGSQGNDCIARYWRNYMHCILTLGSPLAVTPAGRNASARKLSPHTPGNTRTEAVTDLLMRAPHPRWLPHQVHLPKIQKRQDSL